MAIIKQRSNDQWRVLCGKRGYLLPNGMVIPVGWPNPDTTGIRGARKQDSDLTKFVGDVMTTADGQIIQDMDIHGRIIVRHQDVIIRRCRIQIPAPAALLVGEQTVIDAGQVAVVNGERQWLADNLTIAYCEVVGSEVIGGGAWGSHQTGIASGLRTTIDHCLVWNLATGVAPGNGSVITSSCLYDGGSTSQAAQRACCRLTTGSSIICQDSALMGVTALQFGAQTGPLTAITINHNYLAGSTHAVAVDVRGEGANGPIGAGLTNNVFSNLYRDTALTPFGRSMVFAESNVWERHG